MRWIRRAGEIGGMRIGNRLLDRRARGGRKEEEGVEGRREGEWEGCRIGGWNKCLAIV